MLITFQINREARLGLAHQRHRGTVEDTEKNRKNLLCDLCVPWRIFLPEYEIELNHLELLSLAMNATLTLDIPAEALASARMTLDDVRLELAISLFRMDRLSLGKAAEFALLPVGVFQNHLASRKLGPHYDIADALEDAALLASIPR